MSLQGERAAGRFDRDSSLVDPRLGRAALALIGKFPAEEVTSNRHRLKEVLETGRVTDTSYSVAGKFVRG